VVESYYIFEWFISYLYVIMLVIYCAPNFCMPYFFIPFGPYFQSLYLPSFFIFFGYPNHYFFAFFSISVFIAWNHKSDNETRWFSIQGRRTGIENRFSMSIKGSGSQLSPPPPVINYPDIYYVIKRDVVLCASSTAVSSLMGFWWTLQVRGFCDAGKNLVERGQRWWDPYASETYDFKPWNGKSSHILVFYSFRNGSRSSLCFYRFKNIRPLDVAITLLYKALWYFQHSRLLEWEIYERK